MLCFFLLPVELFNFKMNCYTTNVMFNRLSGHNTPTCYEYVVWIPLKEWKYITG